MTATGRGESFCLQRPVSVTYSLTVFRWDQRGICITKSIYSCQVSDTVRGQEKVLSQRGVLCFFFPLVAVVVKVSLWTFEMRNTVKPPYNTAHHCPALEMWWARSRSLIAAAALGRQWLTPHGQPQRVVFALSFSAGVVKGSHCVRGCVLGKKAVLG